MSELFGCFTRLDSPPIVRLGTQFGIGEIRTVLLEEFHIRFFIHRIAGLSRELCQHNPLGGLAHVRVPALSIVIDLVPAVRKYQDERHHNDPDHSRNWKAILHGVRLIDFLSVEREVVVNELHPRENRWITFHARIVPHEVSSSLERGIGT